MGNIQFSCNKCIFATYTNLQQDGCSLKKLDKYREAKYPIKKVHNNIGGSYYQVNGIYCYWKRDYEWSQKYVPENYDEVLEQELSLKYDLLIDCIGHTNIISKNKLDKLNTTISHYLDCKIKPQEIIVICDFDISREQYKFDELYHHLRNLCSGRGVKYSVFSKSYNYIEKWELETHAINYTKSPYFILAKYDTISYIDPSQIHDSVYNKLQTFSVLMLDDNIISTKKVFESVRAINNLKFIDKIKFTESSSDISEKSIIKNMDIWLNTR